MAGQDDLTRYFRKTMPPMAASALEFGGVEAVAEVAPNPYAETDGHAASAYEKAQTGQPLSTPEQFALEAIIIPDQRPAVTIADGGFSVDHEAWRHLNSGPAKDAIVAAIPSVGRIELPQHPSLPYGGTGFIVGDGLVMTNRHVAELFARGLGQGALAFRPGAKAAIDLKRETATAPSHLLEVREVVMIHPYWDMALLKVAGLPTPAHILTLSLARPEDLLEQPDVAAIGYPAFDPRNNADVQNEVFKGVYNIKRLMPGKLGGRGDIQSFGHNVSALTHDGSTLGGASGSAVVHISSGDIAALHFGGLYLQANYGVPAWELARDARVVDAGVLFAGQPTPDQAVKTWWQGLELPETVGAAAAAGSVTFSVPLEITVRLGGSAGPVVSAAATTASAATATTVEGLAEPFHTDLGVRNGYDPMFLGPVLSMPEPKDKSRAAPVEGGGITLKYVHHSIVMDKRRRLAMFTASNIDNSTEMREPEPGRDYTRKGLTGLGDNDMEKWFSDPRIAEDHQLPDRFFTKDKGAFDKGHIVRRDDVAWGQTYDELRAANGDTYYVTNCSPQVGDFNRSALGVENWGDLENNVLKQARAERLSVFAGPVMADNDPIFVGRDGIGPVRVQIPNAYWKVVAAAKDLELQSFGFLLEQDLADTPLEFVVDDVWRAHMIPLADLEARLQIKFPEELIKADQSGAAIGEAVRAAAGL